MNIRFSDGARLESWRMAALAAIFLFPIMALSAEQGENGRSGPERFIHPQTLPGDLEDRVNVYRDVVYGLDDPDSQKLDAYILKSDTPTPVLIEIHGGGFTAGSKSAGPGGENWRIFFENDWVYMQTLRAGISLVSIDYRLAPPNVFPAPALDLARTIQYVRAQAAEWNIDPSRIACCGTSAGGHLSAWIGLHGDMADPQSADPIARQSTRITAFVDIDGPMDFARMAPMERLYAFLNSTAETWDKSEDSKTMMRISSPLTYASPDDPPGMIVYTIESPGARAGSAPEIVTGPHSFWWGVILADALRSQNIEFEDHISADKKGSGAQAVAIIAFLKKHLKPAGEV